MRSIHCFRLTIRVLTRHDDSAATAVEWAANLYSDVVGRAPAPELAEALRRVERFGQLCAMLELPLLPTDRRRVFEAMRSRLVLADLLEEQALQVLAAVQAALIPLEG